MYSRERPSQWTCHATTVACSESIAARNVQIAVFSEYNRPAVLFVRGGTLDDPTDVTPDVHIFTRSKVAWVAVPLGAPAFEVHYDPKKLWPAESLRRIEAVPPGRP